LIYPGLILCFAPACEFSRGKLKEINIYPIDQGYGRPVLAEGEVANRVIERVFRLAHRYRINVVNRAGVGVIEPRNYSVVDSKPILTLVIPAKAGIQVFSYPLARANMDLAGATPT